MSFIDDDRVCQFHVGQVWESPRGYLYKVIGVQRGGQAVLRLGVDGTGRIVRRDWDAVINWVLYSDS
ncbi:MAG: recombinase [Gammaproteobacteria bacterium]|nr:MAG: recombinase [Gammaproteobacteria bacterium]